MPKTKRMPARPDRLKVAVPQIAAVGVDRSAKVIRGFVVAQLGPFKSDGRGEFDQASLDAILELWPAAGLRSRFTHPTESSDGLGKFLGRARDPVMSTATIERDGAEVEIPAIRADLHLAASAFKTPNGNLGQYVLDLAEEDPGALSSSLVLRKLEEWRRNPDKTLATGPNGETLPPLWRPKRLFASDLVDEGDAVDGLLDVGQGADWTRDLLARGEELLNKVFAGATRQTVQARCSAFLTRYLDRRFGVSAMSKCAKCKDEQLGANLGGLLDGLIDAAVTDEKPREIIMSEMAAAAAITIEEVSAIVQGTDECPPLSHLEAFAPVLGASIGELVAAWEADGCSEAAGEETPEEAPAEEPPADAPPGEMPLSAGRHDVLRKKLQLKAKV
jgi:hypothetical protein